MKNKMINKIMTVCIIGAVVVSMCYGCTERHPVATNATVASTNNVATEPRVDNMTPTEPDVEECTTDPSDPTETNVEIVATEPDVTGAPEENVWPEEDVTEVEIVTEPDNATESVPEDEMETESEPEVDTEDDSNNEVDTPHVPSGTHNGWAMTWREVNLEDWEIDFFAKLLYCEAGSMGYEGQFWVASAVLNLSELKGMSIWKMGHNSNIFSVAPWVDNARPTQKQYDIIYEVLNNGWIADVSYFRTDYPHSFGRFMIQIENVCFSSP